jgi:hypothetical protein
MTTDSDVLARIEALVAEEHDLRERDELAADTEHQRLQAVEVELDRCWDLLRQRRALRESGQDPDRASVRPGEEVEGYLG